jgi:hypothetical protein
MKRWIKNIRDTVVAITAMGLLVVIWLLLVQILAIAIAIGLGLLIACISGWQTGVLVGILAYAGVMKLAWYLEIFNMIGLDLNKRTKNGTASTLSPVTEAQSQSRATHQRELL